MKVRRVILRGVNNFERFDYCFEDEWTQSVPDSLLLIGPNGSGKTTLLNVIAGLWELFGQLIQSSEGWLVSDLPDLMPPGCQWVAIELVGLESHPVWIYYKRGVAPTDLPDKRWVVAEKEAYRIGATKPTGLSEAPLVGYYFSLGAVTSQPLHEISPKLEGWRQSLTENVLGKSSDLANLVFLESENRLLPKIDESSDVIREPEEFRWLARYEPAPSRKGSLENYLFNLSAVDKPTFDRIVNQVNDFLIDKRIAGFDARTRNLMVEVGGGDKHPVDQLSSGEKQVLLMIAFITRWLRPGGIVLIDEPDLHLHVSWTNALVDHLRRMVAQQNGQLIVASHAAELWERFTPSHRVELGDANEVRG